MIRKRHKGRGGQGRCCEKIPDTHQGFLHEEWSCLLITHEQETGKRVFIATVYTKKRINNLFLPHEASSWGRWLT